jgi:hypothetical protein
MSESKHTPGPWEASEVMLDSGKAIMAPGRRRKQTVATVYRVIGYEYDTSPEAEANARLIAAAPELLAALEALAAAMESVAAQYPDDLLLGSEYADARAAIAKAKGA